MVANSQPTKVYVVRLHLSETAVGCNTGLNAIDRGSVPESISQLAGQNIEQGMVRRALSGYSLQ